MKTYDFYSGFEGEPELTIYIKNDNIVSKISLWIGYFDEIIKKIKTNKLGYWEGIPLHYHLLTGWYNEESWECKDVNLFIIQLEEVLKENLDVETIEILNILIKEAKNCKLLNYKMYFDYF